jgi:hypothetical protein
MPPRLLDIGKMENSLEYCLLKPDWCFLYFLKIPGAVLPHPVKQNYHLNFQ